jgi:sulfonate transport system ATP-binding protein
MTDTIEITGLCKTYRVEGRTVEVLRDLDLTVPAREITVLLGRSGCGKTTLLRLIGGLEKADSGTIRRPAGSRTAFVFQEARLMPWLTVEKNIAFGLKKKDIRCEELDRLITMTGLDGFADALPGQLSGGMQQRAALARALAMKPDFILMDEPFAALDHFTREKMQNFLLELH